MLRGLFGVFQVFVFAFLLAGTALAEQVKGTISEVGEEGREISVKDKSGKTVDVKISGSRTKIEGAKSRSDLKEGQSVTVEHENGEAKNVKVAK